MVIPWLGFPLKKLVERAQPTSHARFVELRSLEDASQLPNQESNVLPWPYVEGLRLDEATNPLAFLAVGLYGGPLPGQNGAPLRLVVPWKYGFKGAKSIVELRFTRQRPATTWNQVAPREYGFFANVNPNVDHPRWSQENERRIGELERRPTLLFNGYAEWVVRAIAVDIAKRPFILVGFVALVLLVPLALTSSKQMLMRLGFRRWKLLHRLTYLVVVLGLVHFFLRVKADVWEPAGYALVVLVLFSVRLGFAWAARRNRSALGVH